MSKRRRRRSSRRRKSSSSSSSKQSASQYVFSHPNKDDAAEKGEADSFGKEFSDSKEEDKCFPPEEKRFKYRYQMNVFPNQRNIYTATTNDEARGVKIVTSVSVDDVHNNSAPNIMLQQSQEPLAPEANPGSSIVRINCKGSDVKLELEEINTAGIKTSFVLCNEKGQGPETVFRSTCEKTPSDEQSCPAWSIHNQYTPHLSFTVSRNCEAAEEQENANGASSLSETSTRPQEHSHDRHPLIVSRNSLDQPSLVLKRKYFGKSYSSDQSWEIPPPPQDFADIKGNTLDDLILGVASCRIDGCGPSYIQEDSFGKPDNPFCLEVMGVLDLEQLSDSGYDPMSVRPSVSTNRSSFTKDFIEIQKTKSSLRNNSIATVEHKTCLLPKKRRQTFPRLMRTSGSLQEDHLMRFRDSISSDHTSSFCQVDHQETTSMDVDKFAVIRSYNACKVKQKSWRKSSNGFYCLDTTQQDIDQSFKNTKDLEGDKRDGGFDQANFHVNSDHATDELCRRALAIQVTPPSCCGSEEKILQSLRPEVGQSFIVASPVSEESSPNSSGDTVCFSSTLSEEVFELNMETDASRSDPLKSSSLACLPSKEEHTEENQGILCRSVSDNKEFIKPVEGSGIDHWARRRKLFKDSKHRSSTGEGSITSDITEGSVSEEAPSLDLTTQDTEVGGFYTETFHSAAWIYQEETEPSGGPPKLNSRSRVVSIRERTVRINKGAGDYPWGFRIQFSKPIVVTEVDTNGAAEEAGLMVGDYVLAVNGTDVTSVPHSEAAELARLGPDVLTLVIGSDIARGPNTPRPGCRGYLYKRTQSGLIKGWRKRWFVLTHDCCLLYHRHKRDEGKKLALSKLKLEGAEVGPDLTLGKPFVFKCRPLLDTRVYFFCATSSQEMKRWLEALKKAIHPITQNHVWVDVTRHNSNLPPLAVKNPECLGLLHKMDWIKDSWIQHYCILKDGCLYLYSGIRATRARGGIYLQGYSVREQPFGSRKSTIELKPPSDEFKIFYLCAENPNDNKRWIAAIKASVRKWWPLHQALHDYNHLPLEETRM